MPRRKSVKTWSRDELCDLLSRHGLPLRELLKMAGDLRDQHHGRTVSFSRNVFVPLTNLCRDYCTYCVFRRDPDEPGGHTMSPDEVLERANRAVELGCTEALFSLGDRPEAVFPDMRRHLAQSGYRSTVQYLAAMCEQVLNETTLIPHSNPGLMSPRALTQLSRSNGSLGLMLENVSDRLMRPGMPHHRAPDKEPRRRLRTIEDAGRLGIPFTTGILFGIGETIPELIDSLLAIRKINDQFGHIQEVIIQNFRAKTGTPMTHHPEPDFDQVKRTAAVARLALGAEMNIQVPPNLSSSHYSSLMEAGINDWGGISPLTPDFINPEAPWPHLTQLKEQTESEGYHLRERLSVYPEFLERSMKRSPQLAKTLEALSDADGFRRGGL